VESDRRNVSQCEKILSLCRLAAGFRVDAGSFDRRANSMGDRLITVSAHSASPQSRRCCRGRGRWPRSGRCNRASRTRSGRTRPARGQGRTAGRPRTRPASPAGPSRRWVVPRFVRREDDLVYSGLSAADDPFWFRSHFAPLPVKVAVARSPKSKEGKWMRSAARAILSAPRRIGRRGVGPDRRVKAVVERLTNCPYTQEEQPG
jgi:hypothetical protein